MPATKTQQKVVLFRSDRASAAALSDQASAGVSEVVSLLGSGWRVVRLAPTTPSQLNATDKADGYALAVLERDVA